VGGALVRDGEANGSVHSPSVATDRPQAVGRALPRTVDTRQGARVELPSALRDLARDQHGLLARRQLLEAGITRSRP